MGNCGSSPASSTPATDLFGLLPDELVTDILSRIPTRQLRNCSTVCKRWHSLLRTPLFAQEHEKRPASSSVPLVHRGFKQEAESQLIFLKDEEMRKRNKIWPDSKYALFRSVQLDRDTKEKMSWPMSQLRASYHGLLVFEHHPFNSTHCILNPLTREVVTFRNPGRVCGLYYHPPNKQYRFLCFRKVTTADSFLYYVCSTCQEFIKEVGTYDFKIDVDEVIDLQDLKENPSHCRAVLYPGVPNIPAMAAGSFLYWPAYKSIDSDRYIMAFDVMNETLQFMPHPLGHPEGRQWRRDLPVCGVHWLTRLFEMGNRLHLFVTWSHRMEVWALQDHMTWRWDIAFSYKTDIRDTFGEPGDWNRLPLTVVDDGELLYLLSRGGIFRTNSCTKRVEFIGDRGGRNGFYVSVCMVNWRRSLVSFKDYL